MPKTQVRQALYQYLEPTKSNLKYLGEVYTALPKIGSESDLFQFVPSGTNVGVIVYLFISGQSETRIALGGPHDGRKWRAYDVVLLCIMQSEAETSEEGQSAFDEFIDDLTAYIEDNRNAGDPTVIFQWGEGGINGGPDIQIDYPIPQTVNGQTMLFRAVVRVEAVEVLET